MKILDVTGRETTLDELNARATAWHYAHDAHLTIDWQAFYRARATFEPSRKRSHAARAGHR